MELTGASSFSYSIENNREYIEYQLFQSINNKRVKRQNVCPL